MRPLTSRCTRIGLKRSPDICILACDSPSYPPEYQEYHQCGCKQCLKDIERMDKEYWDFVERTAAKVAKWPAWKKGLTKRRRRGSIVESNANPRR